MADNQQKRLREETIEELSPESNESSSSISISISKRQKPYNNILSLLDNEEDEEQGLSHDLSEIFTTLEQELSSSDGSINFESQPFTAEDEIQHPPPSDLAEDVMRHLLEASDDELGIPNRGDDSDNLIEVNSNENENFGFAFADNGLWELEDEAANYYTVLQSELFM